MGYEAKKESNRIRRENAKREIRDGATVAMGREPTGSPPQTGVHR